MIIVGIYLFITIFSISVFWILLVKEKNGFIDYREKQYLLQSELRADLNNEWSAVNEPALKELKEKWFRVTQRIDICGFNSYDISHNGLDIIELINKWLTTRIVYNGEVVKFTYTKDFLTSRIEPRSQNLLLAIVSAILLKQSTLNTIEVNYNITQELIEVRFKVIDEKIPILLSEKQKKSIYLLGGKILEEMNSIVMFLPNKYL